MTEMQQQIIQWFANGEKGTSSETMAFVIGFNVIPKRHSYPHDVSDFRRCVQLLEAVPEMKAHLYKLKTICPIWAGFVENWAELEKRYAVERDKGKAPNTYMLIKHITDKDTRVVRIGHVSIQVSQ